MVAVTSFVKDELSRLPAGRACCRRAELAALLRFAGGLYLVAGRVVVEAELDSGLVARRLRREIGELYGQRAAVGMLGAGRADPRYRVQVEGNGRRWPALPVCSTGPVGGSGTAGDGCLGTQLRCGRRVAGCVPGRRLAERAPRVGRAGGDRPGA